MVDLSFLLPIVGILGAGVLCWLLLPKRIKPGSKPYTACVCDHCGNWISVSYKADVCPLCGGSISSKMPGSLDGALYRRVIVQADGMGVEREVSWDWNRQGVRVVERDGVPDWLGARFVPIICHACRGLIDEDCDHCARTGVLFVPAEIAALAPASLQHAVSVAHLIARHSEERARTGGTSVVPGLNGLTEWDRLFANFDGFERNTPAVWRRSRAVARQAVGDGA